MPFTFDVRNTEPIKQKPIAYPEDARAWSRDYCRKQVELGVMEEIVHGL